MLEKYLNKERDREVFEALAQKYGEQYGLASNEHQEFAEKMASIAFLGRLWELAKETIKLLAIVTLIWTTFLVGFPWFVKVAFRSSSVEGIHGDILSFVTSQPVLIICAAITSLPVVIYEEFIISSFQNKNVSFEQEVGIFEKNIQSFIEFYKENKEKENNQ